MTLIYTKRAVTALDNIYHYLLQHDQAKAAIIIHNAILDEIDRLVDFPLIAAIEPALSELPFIYRALVVKHIYKIIYRIEKETIYIESIWDCRQNPKSLKRLFGKRR